MRIGRCRDCKEYRVALQVILELVETMPSGMDEEADPNDRSPEDTMAWTAGLIWQRCKTALGEGP